MKSLMVCFHPHGAYRLYDRVILKIIFAIDIKTFIKNFMTRDFRKTNILHVKFCYTVVWWEFL